MDSSIFVKFGNSKIFPDLGMKIPDQQKYHRREKFQCVEEKRCSRNNSSVCECMCTSLCVCNAMINRGTSGDL